MKFPKEVQEAMQDCILNLIWPKEDIITFFKKHGCTKIDLKPIKKFNDLTRIKIVHLVFRELRWRKDEGLAVYNAMNRNLLNWKNFDKHYFVDLEKLDKEDAIKAISVLLKEQDYLEEE
jgi:hypothetical protein